MRTTTTKLALVFTLLFLGAADLSAQYQAIGVRFGYPWAASYKFFPGDGDAAIEAFAGFRGSTVAFALGRSGWRYVNVGALYQIHDDLNLDGLPNLRWYYGGGASAYLWSYDNDFFERDRYASINVGIHGVLGLDYTFDDAPINLSLDWMPTFILGDSYLDGFRTDRGALSVRYILK